MTIHRPPMPCPPQWQPDDCGCGDGWGNIQQCWNEIEQLKLLLSEVISSMGPIPLTGVTDGSNAKPGEVGEFFHAEANVAYGAYPAVTNTTVSVTVVPPGDWDLWASFNTQGGVGLILVNLAPAPSGISNQMIGFGTFGTVGAMSYEGAVLINMSARGNFTVPTLLPFSVHIDNSQDTGLLAGSGIMMVEGRRRR